MKVYTSNVMVEWIDQTQVEGTNNTLPSSAFVRVWQQVHNPYKGHPYKTWVTHDAWYTLDSRCWPQVGDIIECGTASKRIVGRLVSIEHHEHRTNDPLVMVLESIFLRDLPPIPNFPKAEYGSLKCMVDGAYRSIIDPDGDISIANMGPSPLVGSTLSEGVLALGAYVALRKSLGKWSDWIVEEGGSQ